MIEVVNTSITAIAVCEVEGCGITYNWSGQTAEQCEAFLTAILEVHKKLWHDEHAKEET